MLLLNHIAVEILLYYLNYEIIALTHMEKNAFGPFFLSNII